MKKIKAKKARKTVRKAPVKAAPQKNAPGITLPTSKIHPCLWFDHQAGEAADFYCSVFPGSKILRTSRYGEGGPMPAGSVMVVMFSLAGQKFMGLNAGPTFKFTEAVSFVVNCSDQAEVDHYWDKLCEGGQPSQCG